MKSTAKCYLKLYFKVTTLVLFSPWPCSFIFFRRELAFCPWPSSLLQFHDTVFYFKARIRDIIALTSLVPKSFFHYKGAFWVSMFFYLWSIRFRLKNCSFVHGQARLSQGQVRFVHGHALASNSFPPKADTIQKIRNNRTFNCWTICKNTISIMCQKCVSK